MQDAGLWGNLANFGFPAFVTGFVLWRVDSRLSALVEKVNAMLIIVYLIAQKEGVSVKGEDSLLAVLSKNRLAAKK